MRGVWLALAVGASIVSSAATPVHALNIIRLTRLGDGDVRPGDRVRVQVGFDFSDTTLGGGIDILFDHSTLQFSGFRYSPTLTRDPAFDLVRWLPDGLLVAFGQFDGFSGQQVIGELDLYVAYIAPLPVVKRVEARANHHPAGPFVGGVDENVARILPVEFTGGFDVTILEGPPPAAASRSTSRPGCLLHRVSGR
jgi:hypothetical protein